MDTIEFDIEFLSQKLSENPASPLFARLADLYLQNGQQVEALEICLEGTAAHPDYYAGFIVLGKIHVALKEYSKARDSFAKAQTLSPFNQTIASLLKAISDHKDGSDRTTDENYFVPQEKPVQSAAVSNAESRSADYRSPQTEQFEMPTAEEIGFSQIPDPAGTSGYSLSSPSEGGSFPTHDEYSNQHQARINAQPEQSLEDFLNATLRPVQSPELQQEPEQEATEQMAFSQPEESAAEFEQPMEQAAEPEQIFEAEQHEQQYDVQEQQAAEERLPEEQPADVMTVEEQVSGVEQSAEQASEEYATEEMQSAASDAAAEQIAEIEEPVQAEEPEMVFTSPEQAQLFAEMTGETQSEEPAADQGTNIDELAERLQNVQRIVPNENTPAAGETADENEQSESFGAEMVTPTLAEIYVSQGEYTAAIQAYEILMFSQPGKTAEFQQRVKELQQLQMEKEGLI